MQPSSSAAPVGTKSGTVVDVFTGGIMIRESSGTRQIIAEENQLRAPSSIRLKSSVSFTVGSVAGRARALNVMIKAA